MAAYKGCKLALTLVIFLCVARLFVVYVEHDRDNFELELGSTESLQGRRDRVDALVDKLNTLTQKLDGHLGMLSNGNHVPEEKKTAVVVPDLGEDDGAPAILKNLRKKGVSYGLASRNISKMAKDELVFTVHSILDQTSTICRRKLRMGRLGDGGWEICDDPDVRPRQPCHIYSFGINNDFSFDDMSAQVYGCHVYSFDPSMKKETHNRSSHVHFYKLGLGDKTQTSDKGWKLYTFSDIRKMLGHENTQIDVVKMDIEHAEWPSVKQMFEVGEMKKFKQFLVEFHIGSIDAMRLRLLQAFELEGYKVFYAHKNSRCGRDVKGYPSTVTYCYEVHYVRRT